MSYFKYMIIIIFALTFSNISAEISNFEKEQFQKILVCVGTSILRNVVLAETHINGKTLSKERIKKY